MRHARNQASAAASSRAPAGAAQTEARALFERALAHHRAGDLQKAERAYRAVLSALPDLPEALANLATVLQQQGRLDEAEAHLRAAFARRPDHAGLCINLGALLRAKGDLEGAQAQYRLAVERAPQHPLAHYNLANLLRDGANAEEAILHYRRAIELDPSCFDAHLNLGGTLAELTDFAGAEACLRRALALNDASAQAHLNLGNALRAQGKIADAVELYDAALGLNPDCPETPLARAIALLVACDFARGWPAYEGRWKEKAQRGAFRRFNAPTWQGEPLAGRSILVYGEQGPGDLVMFASCLPELIAQAGQVYVQCRGSVADLFARSFPTTRVDTDRDPATGAWRPEPEVDFVIAIGSLPRFFRRDEASFQRNAGRYLVPDPAVVERWRERYAALGAGPKVGISWRGGATRGERNLRTIDLAAWLPIVGMPGAHFINLQYGDCRDEIARLRDEFGIVIHDWDDADQTYDLDGFAAQIDALDLVISIANTTVHFAGALGRPVWVLAPSAPSWRWHLDREDCLWYPSARLFRQSAGADWSEVVARVAAEFAAHRACLGAERGGFGPAGQEQRVSQATRALHHARQENPMP